MISGCSDLLSFRSLNVLPAPKTDDKKSYQMFSSVALDQSRPDSAVNPRISARWAAVSILAHLSRGPGRTDSQSIEPLYPRVPQPLALGGTRLEARRNPLRGPDSEPEESRPSRSRSGGLPQATVPHGASSVSVPHLQRERSQCVCLAGLE